jgi:hypothetical protein
MGNPYTETRKNRSQAKMPFGRFRGVPISDLPNDYLAWLSELEDLREPLASAVFQEVNNRRGEDALSTAGGISIWIDENDIPFAREIIDRGRRAVAAKHHPDKGGSIRTMQRFNVVALLLTKQLERLEAVR